MILRYYLTCANCHKVVLFRIGISNEDREPFSFECENCSQPISGALVLDQENVQIIDLELKGATFADSQDLDQEFDQEVNYHPAYAHEDLHVDGAFISPFLQAVQSHEEDALELVNRLGLLAYAEHSIWDDVKRIVRNYIAEDWDQFQRGVRKFIPDGQPVELPIDRNRALYQVLELAMSPFVTSLAWSSLIVDLSRYVLTLQSSHPSSLRVFLSEAEKLGYLKAAQQDALNLTIRFFDLISEFKPIVAYWDPENPDADLSRRLKTGKTAFHQVKALYVDAYEFISRALTLIMGLINIHHRNDHNAFPPHPQLKNRFQPSSMEGFQQLSNAPKVELLDEEPLIRDWLTKAIDPQLRNAIGHNTVKYDSKTGDISYPLDKAGAKVKTITYGKFLNLAMRAMVRVHQLNHLIKILYVAIYLPITNSAAS